MSKLLNRSLRNNIMYAGIVLICSIPIYYVIISRLWKYELDEHNIILTDAAGREDSYLIIAAVTGLTLLFFILLMVVFILVNRRVSKRIWQPFYQSLEKIKNFDINHQEKVVFEASEIDEFTELNQSLDKLITRSVSTYNQQKEFADNASHELQTPLAIIQSKLELLMQHQSLTPAQYSIIEDTLKALSRVTRINKNLLLLTKIENSQFMDSTRIPLSDMLAETVGVFTPFAESKGLSLEATIAPAVAIEGNRTLIEILVNNLITNAIHYCTARGNVSIQLSPKSLVITNTGEASLRKDQLFKRFSAAASNSPNTGLGLALVKQICERYGWAINYHFETGQHEFRVVF